MADVVIGNPPFLGGKLLITHMGEDYVSRMFSIASGKTARAGLVATNSIRGGANRRALQAATKYAPDLRSVERRAVG